MRLIKLKNVSIPNLPDNEEPYASRPIPKQGIPLHHLGAVIGGTGSGKSTKILEFLSWYDKAKSFDRLIIFSPTGMKDPKVKTFIEGKHHFKVTFHHQYSDAIMREEVEAFEGDIEEWKMFQRQKQAYDKYLKCDDVEDLSMDDLECLNLTDFEKPKWKYDKEYYPCFAVLIDDHACCKNVFGANCRGFLSELCVAHRHYSCSIYVVSQIFKGFIPKQFRNGIVNLWILFSTKTQKHKEDLAEQLANKIDPDSFIEYWDYAVKDDPHDCLVVDYKAKSLDTMFRKNFDKLIVVNNNNEI
jgi:hypothetical protein